MRYKRTRQTSRNQQRLRTFAHIALTRSDLVAYRCETYAIIVVVVEKHRCIAISFARAHTLKRVIWYVLVPV